MQLSVLLLLVAFDFTSVQGTVDQTSLIHCAVTGCANGAECNFETGVCDCAGALLPDRDAICIIHDSDITGCANCTGGNTVPVGSTGFSCLNPTQCLCKEGWFGPACDKPSIAVNCDVTNAIRLSIGPHWYADRSMFDGIIYFSATRDFTTDILNNVDRGCRYTGHEVLDKIIPGADCRVPVGDTAEGERNLYAYVQFHPNFRTSRDRIISARCLDGAVVSGGAGSFTITDVQPGDRAPIESTTFNEDASGITMSLLAMDRTRTGADRFYPISSPSIAVGTDLAVVLESEAAFSVKTCWATNRIESDTNYDDKKSFYFMEDWCIPLGAVILFNGPVEGANGDAAAAAAAGATDSGSDHVLTSHINAFYFPGVSNIMVVQCLVCIAADACGGRILSEPRCQNTLSSRTIQTSLTGWTPASARRRRGIIAEVQNTTIAVSIKVVDYEGQSDVDINGEDKKGETADCYKSTSVLLPIVLLAALLLVTMVMTFFFCMKVTRYQDQQQNTAHDNVSYKW